MGELLNHLGSYWYHSELGPSDVSYSENLPRPIFWFGLFLQKNDSRKLKLSETIWNRILWNLTKFQLNQTIDRKKMKITIVWISWMSWNLVKFHEILFQSVSKVSAFYLQKQKSFIPKKIFSNPYRQGRSKRWRSLTQFSRRFCIAYCILLLKIKPPINQSMK